MADNKFKHPKSETLNKLEKLKRDAKEKNDIELYEQLQEYIREILRNYPAQVTKKTYEEMSNEQRESFLRMKIRESVVLGDTENQTFYNQKLQKLQNNQIDSSWLKNGFIEKGENKSVKITSDYLTDIKLNTPNKKLYYALISSQITLALDDITEKINYVSEFNEILKSTKTKEDIETIKKFLEQIGKIGDRGQIYQIHFTKIADNYDPEKEQSNQKTNDQKENKNNYDYEYDELIKKINKQYMRYDDEMSRNRKDKDEIERLIVTLYRLIEELEEYIAQKNITEKHKDVIKNHIEELNKKREYCKKMINIMEESMSMMTY